ncbi:MAG: YqaJ viral recombinase family protein [Synergistaceae bacterium]|jgi:putative phage-type endonuclease|nr:YqaJ viral recombinase family protein [Synergistaceae bacterium]
MKRSDTKRQAWLAARLNGIGASEASMVIGENPWPGMNNVRLWEIKTGRVEPEDIGHKPYVRYGLEAEKPLRELFALDFPEYAVTYKAYDLIRNADFPFIFATLDGKLKHKVTGARGVLEIKTTEVLNSMAKEKWREGVPQNYYIQILHQLLATGWQFAVLKAQLKYRYDDDTRLTTKHYLWQRDEVKADMAHLLEAEIRFWQDYVVPKKRPPLILPDLVPARDAYQL